MMKYIAFLRAINVSGKNIIKMVELRNAFESLGFKNVVTYVQSGNVVFDYEDINEAILINNIEDKISQVFGLSVKVIIRTYDELLNIINNNPFINNQNIEPDKLYVTFLSDIPELTTLADLNIKKVETDKFIIISREVYLYCPNGYGDTKLNNTTFEKKLSVTATTRNWKTINKLLELSKHD